MAHQEWTETAASMVVVLAISAGIVAAGEPMGGTATVGASIDRTASSRPHSANPAPSPWMSSRLCGAIRERLSTGFNLAVAQLERRIECRNLFTRLGSDGLEILSTSLYYPAGVRHESQTCLNADAFTVVGGAPTWLCRRFAQVSDRRAAVLVIHEALHHAGLDEWPHDPGGPSSQAINAMVQRACGL